MRRRNKGDPDGTNKRRKSKAKPKAKTKAGTTTTRKRAGDETASRQRLRQHIETLGLIGLDDAQLDAHFAWALEKQPSYSQLLERVLADVAGKKRERSIARRIRRSGLR